MESLSEKRKELKKLYKLMLSADANSRKGQLIEQKIIQQEESVFGEELQDKLHSNQEWQDSIVASYSNAEFIAGSFKEFEIRVRMIIDELAGKDLI